MSSELETKLVIPRSLHLDIKRRLMLEEIISFLASSDLTKAEHPNRTRYLLDNPWGFTEGWVATELNYLLYGRQVDGSLVCTGYHFDYYNFFMYIDMDDPEQMARQDICETDRDLAPHVHAIVYNAKSNRNLGKNLLGTLHNHPHLGFPSRQRMKSVSAVGFSPDDEWWNNWFLERYGTDERKLAFVIYYSDNDFYMGAFRTRHSKPKLLTITIE